MTREKAIEELKYSIEMVHFDPYAGETSEWLNEEDQQYVDACNMAIEALEQEPCEDCISRQAMLEIQVKYAGHMGATKFWQMRDEIKSLPSVTPQPKTWQWIPVSERLPEEETDVLVCNANGDIEISSGSYSTEMKNEFIWYTSGWRFGKVIAWMPLPEPYKAESEVEK